MDKKCHFLKKNEIINATKISVNSLKPQKQLVLVIDYNRRDTGLVSKTLDQWFSTFLML